MKRPLRHVLSYLLFCVILNSCTRTVDTNTSLVGQWQWLYSCGGFAGQKISAIPNIVSFTFNADSSYVYKENAIVKSSDRYNLTTNTNNNIVLSLNNFTATKLWLSPNGEIVTINNDTLTLNDYMISDGYTHYFKRIK